MSGASAEPARPHAPQPSICHGVHGPWPRKKFEESAARAPVANPARGPSAAPAATVITVTGCTPGIGHEEDPPGGRDRRQRGDEHDLLRRVGAGLEPCGAGDEEADRGEEKRQPGVGGVDGDPGGGRHCGGERSEGRQPRHAPSPWRRA